MYRYTVSILTLSLCVLPTIQTQAKPDDSAAASQKAGVPTITVTKLDISDKILNLNFEIENNSDSEIWICEELEFYTPEKSEICLLEDNQLLVIRRQLDLSEPTGIAWARRPLGKYVRLSPGKKRYESLSANVPIDAFCIFEPGRNTQIPRELFYVSHVSIEIGYYVGNLPEMIFNMLLETEKTHNNDESTPQMLKIFGGAITFNYFREQVRNRDEEVWIPYTRQQLKGEKVLRASIDGLRIPCKRALASDDKIGKTFFEASTRLQIGYKPSAFDYFFPFASDQSLLSREEIEHLQSEQTFVVEDPNIIKAFADKIARGHPFHGAVRHNKIAQFDCYRNNEHLKSFAMYGNTILETEQKKRLSYEKGFLNIEMLTPEMQKLEYRVQCAINLRNLYYRLRFYNLILVKHKKESPVKGEVIYPTSTNWLDGLTSLSRLGVSDIGVFLSSELKKPHVCPSVGEGRSTYAMNPNCRTDSPADMVLLFETKAGWNQHGGPGLFTFDNHDPKGGCVLFNDGTVKFIRTQEELQQLRWK